MKTLSYVANLEKRKQIGYEPSWTSLVDRWYQLDEVSFSFCEALNEWNKLLDLTQPDLILLAIEGASNLADFDFVHTGSQSPAKFVYTLPNISAAVIFQILKIHCSVFCLNKGPETLNLNLNLAESFSKIGKKVWIFYAPVQKENLLRREIIFYY